MQSQAQDIPIEKPQVGEKKRFAINVFSNVTVYAVNLLIGLFYTPYLIHNLGVAVYGLIPLATSITNYLSLLTLSINGAIGRFLTIDLAKQDRESANKTFNTGFFGVIGISILVLPIMLVLIPFVPNIFDVPAGYETPAITLFICVVLSFFVSQIDTCFSVSSWAKSRFDLRSAVTIANHLIKVLFAVFLFEVLHPSIEYVGYGVLFASLISLVGDYIIWKYLTPDLRIKSTDFDKTRIRELFGMSGWVVVNQVGTLLFLNIDLIVANIGLGAETAGVYGSIIIFSTVFRSLAGSVSSVFTPTIVNKFAHNDFEGVTHLSKLSTRYMGIAIGLPAGILCGLGGPFLALWLGESFRSYWLLLILIIAHLPINLAVMQLFGIQNAYLKVKIPGIVTLITGVINLVLAIIFSTTFQWGAMGIALAAAIVLTMKNALFTPIYSSIIQKKPWHTFMIALIPGVLTELIAGLIAWSTIFFFHYQNWIEFGIGAISSIFAGVCFVYFVFLTRHEQKQTVSFLSRMVNLPILKPR